MDFPISPSALIKGGLMTNKNMVRYLEALRSGEYKQCQKAVAKTDGSFCAIGVGLSLMVDEGLGEWVPSIDETLLRYIDKSPSKNPYLFQTDYFSIWLGISLREINLIEMNDGRELSFSEIADELEKVVLPSNAEL
jgi:hypothetical protein